jgi:PAP2 superfamily
MGIRSSRIIDRRAMDPSSGADTSPLRRRRRFIAGVVCAIVALLVVPAPARADVVTDWQETTLLVQGPGNIRTVAMVHIAMFDALNSVTPLYHPYAVSLPGAGGASPEAAAAAAAYGVLIRLLPAQQPALDAALAASLATVPDGPAKAEGLALGDAVADAIYMLRLDDGILTPGPPYVPGGAPGDYQLTPPNFMAPVNTGAGSQTPFAMTGASQFRPNGPPRLSSHRYARELEEVRLLGTADPTMRTEEQNLIADWHREQFALNRVARAAVAEIGFDLLTSARLFALLNIAMADAVISVFEAKYVYDFWRPITAIRAADIDGNRATAADPTWAPYLVITPPHPEYPAAHAVVTGAAATVLERFLGHHYGFTTTSATAPGERFFEDLASYVEDVKLARIYGGIHFRTAVEEGAKQGKKVGKWVLKTQLRRLR